MSLSVSPTRLATAAVSAFAPTKPTKVPGYVLDESIPHPKNPMKKITVSILDKIVNNIKNKPDSERNAIDYAVLLFDKLRKINPKMYAS